MKIATAHLFLLLTGPLWLACARVPLVIQCAQSLGLLVLVTHISYWTVWILRRKVLVKLVSGDGKAVLITGKAQRTPERCCGKGVRKLMKMHFPLPLHSSQYPSHQ